MAYGTNEGLSLTCRLEISSEQTQLVINSITDAYSAEGQVNPLTQPPPGMGGFGGGPAPPFPGFAGPPGV